MAAPQAARLAAFAGLPEAQIATLMVSPTVELVTELLAKIEQKAAEHEQLAAQKLRNDVEYESVIRASESKMKVMRTNLERAQNQAAESRKQLELEESSKLTLQTEISELRSVSSSSATDLASLQQRISSLEASNRDTLSLLESKSKAHDELAHELAAKHQRIVELRKELSDLEDKVRAANTTVTSAKFREDALQQEVESLKRSNEHLEQEYNTLKAESSKSNREKRTRIAELQREHEDDTANIDALQRTDKSLRNRIADLEQKAEEHIAQLQQTQEELATQEDNWRAELDTANRLHGLMKERADTEKKRAEFLQEQYDAIQDEARKEVASLEEELETMTNDKDAAEKRVAELEVIVERLESDLRAAATVAPATPRFNGGARPGSLPRTPQRGMSPAAPGSAMKGNLSYTQLVSDYHEARRQRGAEKKRSSELAIQLDQMMQTLEQNQPAMDQLRADHERLQGDVADMSALVEAVGKERDGAKKEARNMEGQVASLSQEGEILRQQLRDLSSQIKVLLLEVNLRDQGRAAFTPEERVRLEQLAASDGAVTEYNNDTDHFISENLVSFKNIAELQEQNAKMLRITRELGDKMEGEDARKRQSQAEQDHEEVQELRQKYERCRDEIKSLITQSQSYIRERDIFRRMLAHRGQMPPQSDIASIFGESVNGEALRTPARNGMHQSVEMSPNSRDATDFNKLIKEMQSHFDSYKNEASQERRELKDQVQGLTTKTSELRTELARKTGELTLASERYEMLQGNYQMLKSENVELQKRTQTASDRAAQMDLRVQSAAEDLVEAKGLVESLRKEASNLKAEKDFWKTIEKRLTEDNQALVSERDRLNSLNSSIQNLLNEREHSDNESRRRLQSQVDSLETEITATKRKLSEAEEEVKRSTLKREYDSQESQTRIDDLVKNIGSVREEYAAVKATKDQLQIRVDELTIELRSAEERVQVLSAQPAMSTSTQDDNMTSLTQGQDLAIQVSELKRDLELAKRDLTGAQEQVEQYKAISQSSEEQLASLNTTHDGYRQEIDALIEDKEGKIKELQDTIERLRAEAAERTTELLTLQAEKDNHDHALREQRAQLESEINRVKDACERAETAARFHQDDLKAQAEIARQAQENYDAELQKHAEASKFLQVARGETHQLRLELVELKTAKEAAEQGLVQSEETWTEAKARFDQEIAEIRSRRDDVSKQNKILHEQLEKVNNQIVELQRSRASMTAADTTDLSASQSNDVAGLQELISYLRKEKEIIEIQLLQQQNEAKRQRQQIEHLRTQLDDTRLKLSQQRRAEENSERNALNHSKLMDTINELNLIRESNATLRLEKTQAQTSLTDRMKELETFQAEVQTLHAKVQELEDLREAQQEDLRMAREARERFEQRYHDVLSRTDSIDPAEFESLKEKTAALELEKEELKTQSTALQEQVESAATERQQAVEEANRVADERRLKIMAQAKDKNREQTMKIKDREAALQQMTDARDQLQSQLDALNAELAQNKAATLELEARLQNASNNAPPGGEDQSSTGSKDAEISSLREQLAQASATMPGNPVESSEIQARLSAAQSRITELEAEVDSGKQSLSKANEAISQLQAQKSEEITSNTTENTEDLRQELLQAIQDVLALREETVAPAEDADMSGTLQDKSAEILAELVARHEKRVAEIDAEVASRTNSVKAEMEAKLANAKTVAREEILIEHESAIKQLKETHQQELQSLNERHKSEVDELQRQVAAASASSENQAQTAPAESAFNAESITIEQTKELLKVNAAARNLVQRNIVNKMNQAKEETIKEWTEKLAEAERKAKTESEEAVKTARDQAQAMETKRSMLKINMAQNGQRIAQAKMKIVETAASETPEMPVKQVWDAAKNAKPAPPPSPQTTTATPIKATGLGSSQYASSPTTAKPPNTPVRTPSISQSQPAATSTPQTGGPKPPVNTSAPPTPIGSTAPNSQQVGGSAPAASLTNVSQEQPAVNDASASAAPAPAPAPAPAAAVPTAPGPTRPPSQNQTRLPDVPGGRGAGQGSGRGHIGSGIPVNAGRGQPAQRGQAMQRGRGRGRGTGIPQPGGAGGNQASQPGGPGGMNPGAKQFVPQKRGLDASEHAGGPDKRQRGGKS